MVTCRVVHLRVHRIKGTQEETILSADISALSTGVKLLPTSTSVVIRLGGFEVTDYVTDPGNKTSFVTPHRGLMAKLVLLIPIDVTNSIQPSPPDSLLELDIDLKPLSMDVEVAIKVSTQPLLVSFAAPVVLRMLDFMKYVTHKNDALVAELSLQTSKELDEVQKRV